MTTPDRKPEESSGLWDARPWPARYGVAAVALVLQAVLIPLFGLTVSIVWGCWNKLVKGGMDYD